EVSQIECAQVDFGDWPADGTGDGVAAAGAQHLEQLWPLRPGDQIDHHVDEPAPSAATRSIPRPSGWAAPSAVTSAALSAEQTAMTVAPRRLASCTAASPTPPDAPVTNTRSAPTAARCSMFSAVE